MMRQVPQSLVLWNRLVFFALVAAAVGVSWGDELRPKAVRLKKQDQTNVMSAVREAIAHEAIGDTKRRDAMLDEVLAAMPDFAPARWQKGFVQTANGWKHVDRLEDVESPSSRETIYRNMRRKLGDDLAGNLELARWCQRRALHESARGHWNRVVSLAPNNTEAHRALGDEFVDEKWVSREQLDEAKHRSNAIQEAQRVRGRKISEWAEGFASGSAGKQKFCETKLRQITDPAAVSLLSQNLARRGDRCALLLVDILKNIPDLEATHELSDLGVRTDSKAVRGAIVSELKTRSEHMVIPPLLLAMSSRVTAEMKLTITNEGALVYRHVFTSQKPASTTAPPEFDTRLVSLKSPGEQENSAGNELFLSPVEAGLARWNLSIQKSNERIGSFLADVTGAQNQKPEDWWKWWNRRQQVEIGDEEPVPAVAKPIAAAPNRNMVSSVPAANLSLVRPQSRKECFVKGTPVWTSRGKVAIEMIQTGDLVLSQDMKTGELAFKAVVQPTQRPPQKVYELEIGCAKLECTGGHAFWVPGTGWIKASELKPGMLVRCANGAEPVLSNKEGRIVETHNLVVADFHSYFVGEEKTLCHDNTDQRPTLAIAPGVYREGEAPPMGRP